MADGTPTVKAVIQYARELCKQAAREIGNDVWARPYVPSDHAARKLSEQHGPEKAIQILRERAALARHKQRAQNELAQRAAQRHERHQREARTLRAAQRAHLTPGQRIDTALAQLAVIQSAPASRPFDATLTTGSRTPPAPRYPGDPTARARKLAHDAVHAIERELEQARRRLLEFEREAA